MTTFPFSTVGFDLDGTLLDTHADLGHALNHALGTIGRPAVAIDACRDLIGGGAKRMLEKALLATGGPEPEETVARMHRALIAFYEANIAVHTQLFPGGAEMLDALAARGVQVAVVTNKLESLARKVLGELGLTPRFFTIIGGDTLGPGRAKPAPDLLHEMLSRSAGGPAAYVGDTTYDTGAARAAGLPCIAVSFGFCDLPPHELGADSVIGHFSELIPALESLQAASIAH